MNRWMKNIQQKLHNEQGGMSILTVSTLAFVIVGSVFLFYYFTVFIEKRQAQNVADAASLTAVQEVKKQYELAMQEKAEQTIQDYLEKLDEESSESGSSGSSSSSSNHSNSSGGGHYEGNAGGHTNGSGSTGSNSDSGSGSGGDQESDREEQIKEDIDTKKLEDILIDNEFDVTTDWMLVVKEPYFEEEFTATQNGDLLYDRIRQYANQIGAAARQAIDSNGGDTSEGSLTFPVEGEPKFKLAAARTLKLEKLGIEEDIFAASAAGIGSKDVPIDVSTKPEFTINW